MFAMRGRCQFVVSICVVLAGWAARDGLAAGDEPAQAVSFETSDNQKISADFFPPKSAKEDAPIVILLHMYGQERSSWKPLIAPLQKAGFAVLAIDMRGHGESATRTTKERVEKRDPKLFADMDKDVWAAYDWLADQKGIDRARFAVVGASVGCSVALRYAALDRSVDAIVCLSPGENYIEMDSKLDAKEITGRKILLMACENEKAACQSLKGAMEGARVKIYEGAAHGTNMLGVVPGVEQEIVGFLTEAVGKPSNELVFGSIKSDEKIYHLNGSGWLDRIKATNMRYWSSPQEAESRGLRPSKSKGPDDVPGGKNDKDSKSDQRKANSREGTKDKSKDRPPSDNRNSRKRP